MKVINYKDKNYKNISILKSKKTSSISVSSDLLTEEEQLTAMANDPEIQAEIAAQLALCLVPSSAPYRILSNA